MLSAIARRLCCTMAQPAPRGAVQQAGVSAALAGVKRFLQVRASAAVSTLTITPEVLDEIDRILAEQA